MSLLDDIRAAGLDARLAPDGRIWLTGPADVRDRLGPALRRRRDELVRCLQCCSKPESCDHVWCDECDDWGRDTGHGCSAHPRHDAANCLSGLECWIAEHRHHARIEYRTRHNQ